MHGGASLKEKWLSFKTPALPGHILPLPLPRKGLTTLCPQPRGWAASSEGNCCLCWASSPQHLTPRDKGIQSLQEHIWQGGSTINLPHFNTPCSQLAVVASSQPGSEQLLEVGILPPLLLPAEPGDQVTATLLLLDFRVCPPSRGFRAPLLWLHAFFFPDSLLISS